jgi:hypothetical protein
MSTRTPRERVVLAVAFFAALPIFAAAYGLPPLLSAQRDRRDRINQQRELLARERELLTHEASVQRALLVGRVAVAGELAAGTIATSTTETALSELADRLRGVSRSLDVRVVNVSVLGTQAVDDQLHVLRLALRVECDAPGLERLLVAVANDPLLMRIATLRVDRSSNATAPSGEANPNRQVLTVSATVEALATLPRASDGADAP